MSSPEANEGYRDRYGVFVLIENAIISAHFMNTQKPDSGAVL